MKVASGLTFSSEFIWRRVHSLMGLWLVLYLILHLVTNSQAALWMGESGAGFIKMVNQLESLPYLHVLEVTLIGIPFAIHIVWGVHRALTAKTNSGGSDGSRPALKFARNYFFSWQRLSSWILLVGVIGHVVQMRFVDQPKRMEIDGKEQFVAHVTEDPGLAPLAERLRVRISDEKGGAMVVSDSPGAAILFMVRNTFKSALMAGFYTVFVLAAAFHAFNGFWTFLITWGAILSYRSQRAMIPVSVIGMGILAFLGLAAIWGSYWLSSYE